MIVEPPNTLLSTERQFAKYLLILMEKQKEIENTKCSAEIRQIRAQCSPNTAYLTPPLRVRNNFHCGKMRKMANVYL